MCSNAENVPKTATLSLRPTGGPLTFSAATQPPKPHFDPENPPEMLPLFWQLHVC